MKNVFVFAGMSRWRSLEVKGWVKFQPALIGLKLGESDPPFKAVTKHIMRRRSIEVKGWVKMQQCSIKFLNYSSRIAPKPRTAKAG